MAIIPQLLLGQVMHKRLLPKVNAFKYGIYYIALPLSQLDTLDLGKWFAINRSGLMSFRNKDHGDRVGGNLLLWIKNILREQGADQINGDVVLITMPRTLGYVFNPISFWLCYDTEEILRAVLCEVNNTFGETHSYLCLHPDQSEILPTDVFESDKMFHVSPFLERTGRYFFRFSKTQNNFGAWIDYEENPGEKKLVTMLTGKFSPWDQANLKRAFLKYPMVSLRSVGLIHWQAVKLISKGIRHISKPDQLLAKLTRALRITNN